MNDQLSAVEQAAQRLVAAAAAGTPAVPVRDLIGDTDQAAAYAVQNLVTEQRVAAGARIVGRKIGLTSRAVQQQIGVDSPDTGVLFDDMEVPDAGTIAGGAILQPKVEAEIAFVLKDGLADFGADAELASPITDELRAAAAAAVDYAVAALEICGSRVQNWDVRITDTIADNASSGLYVLGTRRLSLAEVSPVDVSMTLHRNGELASTGNGRACLGDPLIALAWLARTRAALGEPLAAGDVILSGALGPMVAAEPGDTFVGEISPFDPVSVTFVQ